MGIDAKTGPAAVRRERCGPQHQGLFARCDEGEGRTAPRRRPGRAPRHGLVIEGRPVRGRALDPTRRRGRTRRNVRRIPCRLSCVECPPATHSVEYEPRCAHPRPSSLPPVNEGVEEHQDHIATLRSLPSALRRADPCGTSKCGPFEAQVLVATRAASTDAHRTIASHRAREGLGTGRCRDWPIAPDASGNLASISYSGPAESADSSRHRNTTRRRPT